MKRSWIQRSTKPMRKRGRKTNDWIKTRRQLSAEFAERGITSCELRISPDCKRDSWLSFAHSRKRRFITTEEQLREVGLACIPCHVELDERMSHEEMEEAVLKAIHRRIA